MKRIFFITILILISFTLTSCKGEEANLAEGDSENIKSIKEMEGYDLSKYKSYINEDDIFRVAVYINEEHYKSTEPIIIFSALEYLGDEESIDVWSGRPYFNYTIFKDGEYFCGGATLDSLEKTNFKKEEINLIPFEKSGGYSEDDSDYVFWKDFYSDPELKLPAGTYTITAYCDFSLSEDILSSRYENKLEFEINVKE